MTAATGPRPVLFLHSLAGNAGLWRRQIEHLEPSRLALAMDLPGHGVSDPPEDGDYSPEASAREVEIAVESLGLAPVVLVGHSYGAAVAIALAGERPDFVAGLLLVDPGPDMRSEPLEEIQGFLEALGSGTYEVAIRGHYERALENADPAVRETVLELLAATPREAVCSAMASLVTFDPLTPLAAYAGPRLAVIAEQHEEPNSLHNLVDDLPVRSLGDVSHWLSLDRPAEFNAILDDFLAEIDRQR